MWLKDWVDAQHLPVGVGIDAVSVSELAALDRRMKGVFAVRTFTQSEREDAANAPDYWTFLAGRFAVKEAVFKALAHLTPEKNFDFRRVETRSALDGSPYLAVDDFLQEIMDKAGVHRLLVSITNEGDFAIALAQAVKSIEKEHQAP